MNKYKIYLMLLAFSLVAYVMWVTATYKPVKNTTQISNYTPERVIKSEIPESPELTPEEKIEVQEEVRESYKEIEETLDVKKKSVEQMRNDVHEILDEIIKEDSTVVITFNLTTKNPLIYETKTN
jgi:hypothetical protein